MLLRPTYRCTVVQQYVIGRKSLFPDDKLIKGACYVVTVGSVVACPNDEVGVGVSIAVRDAARRVTSREGAIDVDLQAVHLGPCEENVGPVRP